MTTRHPTTDPATDLGQLSATDLFRAAFNQPTLDRRNEALDLLAVRVMDIARKRSEDAK